MTSRDILIIDIGKYRLINHWTSKEAMAYKTIKAQYEVIYSIQRKK
jgi:hypothetical protein